jgi:hypothetical protein
MNGDPLCRSCGNPIAAWMSRLQCRHCGAVNPLGHIAKVATTKGAQP